jgi:hypothetical protein
MNDGTFDADIDYAVRMVRSGCASVEQAARTCGIPVSTLKARLAVSPPPRTPALLTKRIKAAPKSST